MSDIRRLLRIRRLEQEVAGERLLEARRAWERGIEVATGLGQQRERVASARLSALAAGDGEAAALDYHDWEQLSRSIDQLEPWLEGQQQEVQTAMQAFRAAHREKEKLVILDRARQQASMTAEDRQDQRRLDDGFLALRERSDRPAAKARPGGQSSE